MNYNGLDIVMGGVGGAPPVVGDLGVAAVAPAGPGAGALARIDQHGFDNFQYGLAELQSTFLKPMAEEETLSEFEERLGQGTEAANVAGRRRKCKLFASPYMPMRSFQKLRRAD